MLLIDLILLLKYFNCNKQFLYLIKIENIFDRFCKDIYIIKYQKYSFPYIYFLIFLYSIDQFFEVFQIDKIIFY